MSSPQSKYWHTRKQEHVHTSDGKKQWGPRGRRSNRNINDWEDDRQDRILAELEKKANK